MGSFVPKNIKAIMSHGLYQIAELTVAFQGTNSDLRCRFKNAGGEVVLEGFLSAVGLPGIVGTLAWKGC
jgi:hypothetical protein